MSAAGDNRRAVGDQALAEFTQRWRKAQDCFSATDTPQWKRTQEATLCFKRLPLNGLSAKLRRRIDRHFGRINSVLEPYALQTWDDYQRISAADLTRIEKLIVALADAD